MGAVFVPDQVLLGKNFRPRLGSRQKSSLMKSGVGGGGQNLILRYFGTTPSAAGNSMTGSERPSPEPILKKEASPAILGGREFWKSSGAFKCLEL